MSKPRIAEREAEFAIVAFGEQLRQRLPINDLRVICRLIRQATQRTVAGERRRIRKAIRAEWSKWRAKMDIVDPTDQWDVEDCARVVQGIDIGLAAVRPARRGGRR